MLHLIEIFKAGRHVSASGEAISFSDKDVQAIARAYDPALHKAPLVVGHPKDNSPSYGRAASLGIVGGKLFASCDEVDTSFAEAVNTKRFPKVSASFYKPDSPSNPKQGQYYLRHIGFLGGQPPAVKGLADATFPSFAGTADDYVSFDFAEADAAAPNAPQPPDAAGAGADAAKPEPKKDDPAVEAFLKALPANLDQATRDKLSAAVTKILADAAKPETAEHAERARRLADGERELAKRETGQRRKDNQLFLSGLRAKGIMLPAKESLALSFMDLLHAAPRDVVSFGESETRTPDTIFREDFLAKLQPTVDFRELSRMSDDEGDSDGFNLSEAATKYMNDERTKGRIVHSADAVAHVRRQQKR